MDVVNLFGDDWDETNTEPGYGWNRLRVGRHLGGARIGASVYELPPGQRSWPYHLHYANEELLIVLAGTATVRTPAGEQPLAAGEATLFRRGPEGAHAVRNDGAGPLRIAMISTMVAPEIAEYPDSGKLGVFAGTAPGGDAPDRTLQRFIRVEDVDYYDGERDP